jgi:hypothetical protein
MNIGGRLFKKTTSSRRTSRYIRDTPTPPPPAEDTAEVAPPPPAPSPPPGNAVLVALGIDTDYSSVPTRDARAAFAVFTSGVDGGPP